METLRVGVEKTSEDEKSMVDKLLSKVRGWIKESQEWIKERKAFLIIISVLYLLFIVILTLLWGNREPIANVAVPWDWLWLAVVIGYTLAGVTGTDKNKRALKMLLGKMPISAEIPPLSLTFAPPWLFQLESVPIEIQQIELPGEPEQVWRFKDAEDKELPLGIGRDGTTPINPPKKFIETRRDGEEKIVEKILSWVQPIRVLFNKEDPAHDPLFETSNFDGIPKLQEPQKLPMGSQGGSEDPARYRVTAEVSGVMQWRVRGIAAFLRTYETFENATKLLADTVVTEMTSALLKGTPDRAQINQDLLGQHILRKIRERVDHEVGKKKVHRWFGQREDLEFGKVAGEDADKKPITKTVLQDEKSGEIIFDQLGHPDGETICCRRGIEIVLFQLKPLVFSRSYNNSIQEVPMAEAKAQADAKKGRGEKDRMKALMEHAGTKGGEMMLALEQLETIKASIGKKDDKIVLVDSSNPVAGIFGGITAGKHLVR